MKNKKIKLDKFGIFSLTLFTSLLVLALYEIVDAWSRQADVEAYIWGFVFILALVSILLNIWVSLEPKTGRDKWHPKQGQIRVNLNGIDTGCDIEVTEYDITMIFHAPIDTIIILSREDIEEYLKGD